MLLAGACVPPGFLGELRSCRTTAAGSAAAAGAAAAGAAALAAAAAGGDGLALAASMGDALGCLGEALFSLD